MHVRACLKREDLSHFEEVVAVRAQSLCALLRQETEVILHAQFVFGRVLGDVQVEITDGIGFGIGPVFSRNFVRIASSEPDVKSREPLLPIQHRGNTLRALDIQLRAVGVIALVILSDELVERVVAAFLRVYTPE